jgi:hypothetical protein
MNLDFDFSRLDIKNPVKRSSEIESYYSFLKQNGIEIVIRTPPCQIINETAKECVLQWNSHEFKSWLQLLEKKVVEKLIIKKDDWFQNMDEEDVENMFTRIDLTGETFQLVCKRPKSLEIEGNDSIVLNSLAECFLLVKAVLITSDDFSIVFELKKVFFLNINPLGDLEEESKEEFKEPESLEQETTKEEHDIQQLEQSQLLEEDSPNETLKQEGFLKQEDSQQEDSQQEGFLKHEDLKQEDLQQETLKQEDFKQEDSQQDQLELIGQEDILNQESIIINEENIQVSDQQAIIQDADYQPSDENKFTNEVIDKVISEPSENSQQNDATNDNESYTDSDSEYDEDSCEDDLDEDDLDEDDLNDNELQDNNKIGLEENENGINDEEEEEDDEEEEEEDEEEDQDDQDEDDDEQEEDNGEVNDDERRVQETPDEIMELDLKSLNPKSLETFELKSHDSVFETNLEKIKHKLLEHKKQSILAFLSQNNIFIPPTLEGEVF